MDLKFEIEQIDLETREAIAQLNAAGVQPRLVDIVASDDPGVAAYARTKQSKARKLGAHYYIESLDRACSTRAVIDKITELNSDPSAHGIMVSTPLYPQLAINEIIAQISATKDIDGLTPINAGWLAVNEEDRAIIPATALAVTHMLEKLGSIRGKEVVVIGRGKTVGRPVAELLLHRHATVTVCHSQSADLSVHTRRAQILVVAIGRPGFITAAMVRPGQFVIDCGTNAVDGKTCGDVDPAVAAIVEYLSPVPGGVGGLTNALLFSNLLKAAGLQQRGAKPA